MATVDFRSELNKITTQSPTEDQKIALVQNEMVPRKLDNFDDIKDDFDVLKQTGKLDRVNLFANAKISGWKDGREYGRSYRITLPEIKDYANDELIKTRLKTDDNFNADELADNSKIALNWSDQLQPTLVDELEHLEDEIVVVDTTSQQRDETKMDKFLIMGDADYQSEGVVYPHQYLDENNKWKDIAGVHASKDSEGNVTISHTDIVGGTGWTAAYACGGVAKNRHFTSGTSVKEIVRLMLYGDPQYADICYYGALDSIPTTVEELLQLMAPSAVSYNTLLEPGYTWDLSVDMSGKFPALLMPEAMWEVPELVSSGKATISGDDLVYNVTGDTFANYGNHKNLTCDGVWLDRPWVDSETNTFFSDQMVDPADIKFQKFTWTNPEGKLVEFGLWYVDEVIGDTVTDHASHKWSFRFKEN